MKFGPWFATILAALTICSTLAPAAPKCAQIIDSAHDVHLSNEPYADTEMLEREVQLLTVNISLRYGPNNLLNEKLDALMAEVTEESRHIEALQERLMTEEPISPKEIEAVAEKLKLLKTELVRTNAQSVLLLTEHPVGVPPDQTVRNEIHVAKDAEKDLARLQPRFLEKYHDFVAELATVTSPRQLSAKWSAKTLCSVCRYLDDVRYSVRLNRGYRVVFSFEDNRATILAISKTVTHHN